jgi:hypothetical protein
MRNPYQTISPSRFREVDLAPVELDCVQEIDEL